MTDRAFEWKAGDIDEINACIRLALDPDMAQGIWLDNAQEAFRLMRKFNLGIQCLTPTRSGSPDKLTQLNDGPLPKRPGNANENQTPYGQREVPFGKYKGDKLENVLRNDQDYFRWLATKADIINPGLKEAISGLWEAHGPDAQEKKQEPAKDDIPF